MKRNNNSMIWRVIFLLIAIAILLYVVTYTIQTLRQGVGNDKLLEDYSEYKHTQDSIVFELKKDVIKIRQDRLVLLDSMEILKNSVLGHEKIMNSLNFKINDIKKNIKSHPVNFADSSIQAIDNILPK